MNQWIFFRARQAISLVCHPQHQSDDFHPRLHKIFIDALSNRRRKPGQEAAHFKTDENTGKMVIDIDTDVNENEAAGHGNGVEEDIAGNAYRESMTSVDGFTRGSGGRIRFNKDTKKRRREGDDIEDVEMAEGENMNVGSKKSKKKEKSEPRLGQEFKAKVRGSRFLSSIGCFVNLFLRGSIQAESWGRRQEERHGSIRLPLLVRCS